MNNEENKNIDKRVINEFWNPPIREDKVDMSILNPPKKDQSQKTQNREPGTESSEFLYN